MTPKNDNWQVESLRLTAFLAPLAELANENWWAHVVGNPPETRTVKALRGEKLDVGEFAGNILTLSIQPGRIDWLLAPRQSKLEDGTVDFGTAVGKFPDAIETFVLHMSKWLLECPTIIRLAYGAVLTETTKDKESGYRRIAEYLPSVKIDPIGSQDLFYQINRPRLSHALANGSRVNRLSKWSVSSVQWGAVQFGQMQVKTTLAGPQVFACRLEVDISTPAENLNELSHDRLGEIFKELVGLGTEILAEGDIP